MMKNRIHNIRDFLFPKTCINCKKTGAYLCIDCKKLLDPHTEECPYCHKFSPHYQTCINCRIDRHNALEGIIIPFAYTDLTRELILKLKYRHQKEIAEFLAQRLANIFACNQKISPENTIITYTPGHRRKTHMVKGYNQAEVLAEHLSTITEIPLINLLSKPEATTSQVKLHKEQRMVNVLGKFHMNPQNPLKGNETIIVVDDITTTTSTLNEIALTIKHHMPLAKIR